MAVVAQSGTALDISYTSALPEFYPDWIPVDTRIDSAWQSCAHDDASARRFCRLVTATATPRSRRTGSDLATHRRVHYSNQLPRQPASLLWFHDHALGATRLNVFAGLAAAYILRDQYDTGLEPNPIGIPGGAYEIPLVIQDRQFSRDGKFFYPTSDIEGVTWIGEYFGDVMLVNGKVWPYLNVEPRMYRFRILNGCNARILNLDLSGLDFWQIGAEGGMWDIPVRTRRLVTSSGRASRCAC